MIDLDLVLLQREPGGITRLTFNRPDKLNALDEALGDALKARVEALQEDDTTRVVVLSGAGRAFSTGGDLSMLAGFQALDVAEGTRTMKRFYERFLSLRDIPVPVIAAIRGPAIGAGACLTLACDLRVAREDATLAFNFVKLGLHPGAGATYFLPRVVGPARAQELLMTGRGLTGAEAATLGLVNKAVPADQFEAAVTALAEELAATGPLAARQLKEGLRAWHDPAQLEVALQHEARSQARCYQTADFQEGIRAARERRRPRFTFS